MISCASYSMLKSVTVTQMQTKKSKDGWRKKFELFANKGKQTPTGTTTQKMRRHRQGQPTNEQCQICM